MTLISISIDSTFNITPGHDSLNHDGPLYFLQYMLTVRQSPGVNDLSGR